MDKRVIALILPLIAALYALHSCSGVTGKSGSMSRFAVAGDRFYAVADNKLQVFNIENAADPEPVGTVDIDSGAETLYYYKDNTMLIGGTDGMYIYSLKNPDKPEYISEYEHLAACDPVVADGDIAYFTLRDGTGCRNSLNELNILDISDIYKPKLLKRYEMDNPHGLGIDGTLLFVADNDSGLKVFNIIAPGSVELRETIAVKGAYDVIAFEGYLLLVADGGLYGYRTTGEKLEAVSELH